LGFWTWRTYEVLAMIEWMRAHNSGAPDTEKVRFVGIDPQRCGESIAALDAFLRVAALERAEAFGAAFAGLADARPGVPFAGGQDRLRNAQELVAFLEGNAADLTELTSAVRFGEALRHARRVVRAADVVSRPLHHEEPERSALAARDRYMAEAVAELLDGDDGGDAAKVAVWAHNGHIMTGHYSGGVPALGRHLRQRYGDAYYGLGLLFGEGAFRACRASRRAAGRRRPVRLTVGAAGRGSGAVEAELSEATAGSHMVNLRTGEDAPPSVREWLRARNFQRSFGSHVPRFTYRLSLMPTVLAEEYDGLVFIPESTCSRPLPLPEGTSLP
ncbi:erythromycin esterase family protein, partial [Streptomyces sp. NPDC057654]|uniref:erythromycin esterase family protein n=1 Tax=Streptomyces sp. NPDC057654 TaxID=3346196 RepID=UPI0036A07CEF